MLMLCYLALQQALLFLPLVLGIYLSYRILNVTDLTVEGTFMLGAAVFARAVTQEVNEVSALLLGLGAGAGVGIMVALIQRYAAIDSLIASILALFMLYSVNFKIMGKPNISLLDTHTVLQQLQEYSPGSLWLAIALFLAICVILLYILLHTRYGLLLRAFGTNRALLARLGRNTTVLLIVGLVLSNMLAALCGILTAQINGYADLSMAMGMALTGIGSLMIGLKLASPWRQLKFNALIDLLACMVGVFIYFFLMNLLLYWGVDPIYIRCFVGVMLIFFLSTQAARRSGYAP